MMQDIDKHRRVKSEIGVRNDLTVKTLDWNSGTRTNQHVDARNRDVPSQLLYKIINYSIAATDVENPVSWADRDVR